MNWDTILRSKTFWTAIAGIIGTFGAYMAGEISLGTFVQTALLALIGIFLRDGIAKIRAPSPQDTQQDTPQVVQDTPQAIQDAPPIVIHDEGRSPAVHRALNRIHWRLDLRRPMKEFDALPEDIQVLDPDAFRSKIERR